VNATQTLNGIIDQSALVMHRRGIDRTKVVEKINNGYSLTSFDYDALIEGDAKATVWTELATTVEGGREQGSTDEELLAYIQRQTMRRATNFRAPGSSSGSDNQSSIAQHVAWLEAFQLVNY
jgi:hypothetical protein